MLAAYVPRYGDADVIEIAELPRPEITETEVLVKVHASAVNTADWRLRAAAFPGFARLVGRLMFGLFAPKNKVPGGDFSGRIVARGAAVTRFQDGDAVFGTSLHGANAEYLRIGQDGAIARKPETLSHVEAAAVPFGALSALVFLRDFARVTPGQKVLITGASGGLGVFAVQLAKHSGAEVTAVCSRANHALVKSLGADHVIDYHSEDFADGSARYDLILDIVGRAGFRRCRRVLTPRGIYLPIEFDLREIVQSVWTRLTGGQRVLIGVSGDKREDLEEIARLLADGTLRPVIDRTYPLDRIADAHRRVEGRHKTGSVVLTMPDTTEAAAKA